MMPPYTVVVPSRQRPALAKEALSILPESAVVSVEESEVETYAKQIDESRIVPHPPLVGMARIRQWLLDHWKDHYVCMVDDDFDALVSLSWKTCRRYRKPEISQRVIENGVQCLDDLKLGIYGWSRRANPLGFNAHDPFNLVTYAAGAFIVAPGRKYKFDEKIMLLDDIDLSLSSLLHDRVQLVDQRWYWDFGKTFATKGGSQTIRTQELHESDARVLKQKWGGAFEVTKRSTSSVNLGKGKNKSPMSGIHIAVQRKSPLGAKS